MSANSNTPRKLGGEGQCLGLDIHGIEVTGCMPHVNQGPSTHSDLHSPPAQANSTHCEVRKQPLPPPLPQPPLPHLNRGAHIHIHPHAPDPLPLIHPPHTPPHTPPTPTHTPSQTRKAMSCHTPEGALRALQSLQRSTDEQRRAALPQPLAEDSCPPTGATTTRTLARERGEMGESALAESSGTSC